MVDGAPALEVERLGMTFARGGRSTEALAELSFAVDAGELCCLVGPSGCGKTTLLRILAGLVAPTRGQVRLGGEPINGPPRDLALVFQEYGRSLLPWLSVRGNVELPLRGRRLPRARRRELVDAALAAVALEGVAERHPGELSGGMQQRVALARALACEPRILLLDEPFASVDAQARADLQDLLLRVWTEAETTVVFVTHDVDESVYLADRVIALSPAPTHVKEVVDVSLPRPRDQLHTKGSPHFARTRSHVYRLVADASG